MISLTETTLNINDANKNLSKLLNNKLFSQPHKPFWLEKCIKSF